MDYMLLKHVHDRSQERMVKVRVTRITKYLDPRDPSKILRLNFVLLDEENATMTAEIQEEWIPIFAPKIQEGTIYYIRYFRVAEARDTYRAVDRPFMARFTKYTKLTEVTPPPSDFPLYACSLVQFQTLRERDNDNTICSDIIGIFTGCTHVRLQGTKGGPKKLRNVYLTDGMETVSVALWGSHAEDFPAEEYMQAASEKAMVFLFVGLTSRVFKNSISLQGSLICKWYVEPALPEAQLLRQKFIALSGEKSEAIWYGSAVPISETEDINVADLASVTNPHTICNKKYTINVKIKCLKDNQQWWYHACFICNRHAILEGDAYRCSVRKCTSTKGGPRYRLPLIAIDPASSMNDDDAPSIELVVFGPRAEEMLGIPVHNLIATQSGIGFFLPNKITDLYGRQFRMRISLSPSSLDRKDISFQVSSVFPVPANDTGKQRHGSLQFAEQLCTPSEFAVGTSEKDIPDPHGHINIEKPNQLGDKQETMTLTDNIVSTPPPHQTPGSVEPKTYKRARDDDETGTGDSDEGLTLSTMSRERRRPIKKLKFDANAKEKQVLQEK